MLKSASGIVIIPNDPQLRLSNWKDKGTFLNFRVVSQEATTSDKARLHHYQVSIYVPNNELETWKEKIVPGKMFLLTNGGVSAIVPAGKEYPFIQIQVDRGNFSYLKKTVTIGD